jgi:hypothetical protein
VVKGHADGAYSLDGAPSRAARSSSLTIAALLLSRIVSIGKTGATLR